MTAIPQCGLLSWFDRENSRKDLVDALEDPLEFNALFWPMGAAGIDLFPEKVRTRVLNDWYRLIVWIGKDSIDDSPVKATLAYSHELRHVAQFLHNPQFHYMSCLARQYLIYCLSDEERSKYRYYDIPAEFDAERHARVIAATLLNEESVRAYYDGKRIHEFVNPIVPGELRDAYELMRRWLARHIEGIRKCLACDCAARGEIRDRVADVDWDRISLPDPRN